MKTSTDFAIVNNTGISNEETAVEIEEIITEATDIKLTETVISITDMNLTTNEKSVEDYLNDRKLGFGIINFEVGACTKQI